MFFPVLLQAAAFCAHFDLQLTEDEVHFARSMSAGIKLQEKALPPKKSVPLVLSKNSKCLGEVSSNFGCYTVLLHQIRMFPLFTCSYTVLLHHCSAVVTKCYIIRYRCIPCSPVVTQCYFRCFPLFSTVLLAAGGQQWSSSTGISPHPAL